jgi:hypothetical protein
MTTRSLIASLKGHPLALVIVVIVAINTGGGIFIIEKVLAYLREERTARVQQQTATAASIRELIQHCVIERERR